MCWGPGSVHTGLLRVLELGAWELPSAPQSGLEDCLNAQPRSAVEAAASWKLSWSLCLLLPVTFCAKAAFPWLAGAPQREPGTQQAGEPFRGSCFLQLLSTEIHTCSNWVTTGRWGWKVRPHLSLQNVNDLYLVKLDTLAIA